jgi:transposase-like protein
MTRKQDSAARLRWKEELKQLLAEDRDLLKGLIQDALQQVLEVEMDEALQAEKGERTAGRRGIARGITAGCW